MHFYVTTQFKCLILEICSQGSHKIMVHQKKLRPAETTVLYCIINGQIKATLYICIVTDEGSKNPEKVIHIAVLSMLA